MGSDTTNKKEIAIIQASGFGKVSPEDTDNNQVPDVMEISKLAGEQQKSARDYQIKMAELICSVENYEDRMKNIVFVNYDSPFADRDFLDKIKKLDSSKPFLFVKRSANLLAFLPNCHSSYFVATSEGLNISFAAANGPPSPNCF
mgnify:CR=1 FL=1